MIPALTNTEKKLKERFDRLMSMLRDSMFKNPKTSLKIQQ
jgi:hypothetical protein